MVCDARSDAEQCQTSRLSDVGRKGIDLFYPDDLENCGQRREKGMPIHPSHARLIICLRYVSGHSNIGFYEVRTGNR